MISEDKEETRNRLMYNCDCYRCIMSRISPAQKLVLEPDLLIRITKKTYTVFIQMTWCFQVWTLIKECPFKFIFKSEAGKAHVE